MNKFFASLILFLLFASVAFAGGLMLSSGATGPGVACSWSTVWNAEWSGACNSTAWADYSAGGDRNTRIYLYNTVTTGGGSKVRVSLKGHSTLQSDIGGVSIGPKKVSADPFDFVSAPTNITFNTGNDTVSIGAGQTEISDEISFTFSTSTDYLVAIYSSDGDMSYLTGASTIKASADGLGFDDSETVDVSAYTQAQYCEWLTIVEVCN